MLNIQNNFDLKDFNTWKVGGAAEFACFPSTPQEVREACLWAKDKSLAITIISGGSNVLVSDQGIAGLTIILKELSGVEQVLHEGDITTITCLAGTPKSDVLKVFVKSKQSPAIFLAGLPGDMGGGVVMNAGVGHDLHPKEFCEFIDWIEYVDLSSPTCEIIKKQSQQLQWSYRKCEGWQPGVITRMGLSWREEGNTLLIREMQDSNKRRMTTQPLTFPSCGSVFKNPPNNKSGRLIEECGLKGFKIGGAEVSTKHANFIINTGGATATDIAQVISHVQQEVLKQKQIELHPECIYLGRW